MNYSDNTSFIASYWQFHGRCLVELYRSWNWTKNDIRVAALERHRDEWFALFDQSAKRLSPKHSFWMGRDLNFSCVIQQYYVCNTIIHDIIAMAARDITSRRFRDEKSHASTRETCNERSRQYFPNAPGAASLASAVVRSGELITRRYYKATTSEWELGSN